MTKIAIISQGEQGVLIDISGCSSLQEAKQYLHSTLQVSSQFWEGLVVDLNLGPLVLTPEQVNEIGAIVSGVGVQPRQIFSISPITRASLLQCRLPIGSTSELYTTDAVLEVQACQSSERAEFEQSITISQMQADSVQAAMSGSGQRQEIALENSAAYPRLAELERMENASAQPTASVQSQAAVKSESGSSSLPDLFLNARKAAAGVSLPLESPIQADTEDLKRLLIQHELDKTAKCESVQTLVLDEEAGNLQVQDTQLQSQTAPAFTVSLHAASPASAAVPAAAELKAPARVQAVAKAPAVLLMKQTLRSGQRVSHKGHLVIIGDVNPGAELVADGDITVWGALRGMAHAGAGGNSSAEIRALKLEPLQLRIANAIARSPDRNKRKSAPASGPETARVVEGKIRIQGSEPD